MAALMKVLFTMCPLLWKRLASVNYNAVSFYAVQLLRHRDVSQ